MMFGRYGFEIARNGKITLWSRDDDRLVMIEPYSDLRFPLLLLLFGNVMRCSRTILFQLRNSFFTFNC